jgi:hypothetical protein
MLTKLSIATAALGSAGRDRSGSLVLLAEFCRPQSLFRGNSDEHLW